MMLKTKKIIFIRLSIIALAVLMFSCGYHTRHFMFKSESSILKSDSSLFDQVAKNYVLQVNDKFNMRVFTNNGELLIDPNSDFARSISGSNASANQSIGNKKPKEYLVAVDGRTKFPMVGWKEVESKTIFELETALQKDFSKYYVDVFVEVRQLNRRVLVFSRRGAVVVPLLEENMNLIEVLALANQGANGSNMQEIKIIRGDLKDPEVLLVDLSTIDGLKATNLMVQANDIIYVKPTRNAVNETIKDVMPVVSAISTLITTIFVIISLNQP